MNSSRPGSRVPSPVAASAAERARSPESASEKVIAPRRRTALLATGLTVLLGTLVLAGCGQAPGETGLDYVEDQGIRVAAPLYHLSFDDLPVDSAFGTEVPLNHYGESLLVVGRESDYVAKARLGFQITTKAQRDSLTKGLHLRLSALPLSNVFAGRDWLRDAVRGRDTLRLLVESYSWVDSTGSYAETLGVLHRRIINTPVPFSTLDPRFRRLDTIRVSPSAAYPDTGVIADTLQAGALPHLQERLTTGFGSDSARRWAVFVEISPLTTADSGMFRFIGQAVASSNAVLRRYNSGLWLGRFVEDSLQTVGTLVTPYRSGFLATPATNYETRHTGAATNSLLFGVARGLHVRINRDTLLNRIRLKLNARDPADPTLGDRLMGADPAGRFDRRFYIPYAAMRLPVDTGLTRVDGPFALDMSVATDIDSLGLDTAAFRGDHAIAAGDSLRLTVYGGSGSVSVDTLAVSYRRHPVDTALRQILTRWVGAASAADTFITVPDGKHRELTLSRREGWRRAATLGIKPGAAALGVEVFFNTAGVIEPRDFLNADGDLITTTSVLSRRFWRPGADSLTVRVTRGMQNLLNRVHAPGVGVAPDFFLRGTDRAAYDTALVSSLTYRKVAYPVFGEVAFKRTGGRLVVGLELYLYPLEAGR